MTWTAATDPGYPDSGSGVVDYEVQIGTTTSGFDVIAWTSVGNITTFDDDAWAALVPGGLELQPDNKYYFQVRAVDAVGLKSSGAEVSIEVDAAVPTDPGVPTAALNPTGNPVVPWTWTPSTDPAGSYTSGLKGYYVKLGTTSG